MTVIKIFLTIIVPFIILKYRNSRLVNTIGIQGSAYLFGLCFSLLINLLLFSGTIEKSDDSIVEIIAYLAIAMAIPLLLFSNNIKFLLKLSKKTLLSFFLLVISVLIVSAALYAVFTKNVEFGNIFSGMAVALYTGGTPNLNTVGLMFGLKSELLLCANISDMIFGGIFYIFLLFFSKPLVSKVLPAFTDEKLTIDEKLYSEKSEGKFSLRDKGVIRNIAISFLIVIAGLGIGLAIWLVLGAVDGTMTNYLIPALMLTATIGGLAGSFNSKISTVEQNNTLGQYFAAVFSYSIASMVNLKMIDFSWIKIFAIYAIITTLTFVVHLVLCRIFNTDADTMIVTSTAGIYGPAFIPGVCKAIGADYMLAPGLVMGSFGYAIGSFLGIGFIYLLELF